MSNSSQITISSKKLLRMVWDIHSKFCTSRGGEKEVKHGEKMGDRNELLADIYLFILKNYGPARVADAVINEQSLTLIWKGMRFIPDEVKGTSLIGEINLLIEAYKGKINFDPLDPSKKTKAELVSNRSFQQFESHVHEALHAWNGKVGVGITKAQLLALHLYTYGRPYSDDLETDDFFYLRGSQLYLIETRLKDVFIEPLQRVFQALRKVDQNGGSKQLLRMAADLFIDKTAQVCEELSQSIYNVEEQLHLPTLKKLMKFCSAGFGVNIPEFEEHWDRTAGNEILEINRMQKLGQIEIAPGEYREPFDYIRIFFVKGDGGMVSHLTDREEKMILKQLDHKVKIILVFPGAWPGSDIRKLDFAVLRIDDCPALIGTTFSPDGTQAVFYLDHTKAERCFNDYLKDILTQKNEAYIYWPDEKDSKITLRQFDSWSIKGLSETLGEICAPSEKRNGYHD